MPETIIAQVSELLALEGVEGYIVGGYVRDVLLGRWAQDIDIAIAGDALEVGRHVADCLGGTYVPLDKEHRIARVVLIRDGGQGHLDIATLHGAIEADLAWRDFTINAMAVSLTNLLPGEKSSDVDSRFTVQISAADVVDPFEGLKDLRAGRIRAVSKQVFQDDPIRLLRAVRLAAQYEFTIDNDTVALIRSHSQLLREVAQERVRDELIQLLSLPRSAFYLRCLDELGLLTEVFPELAEMKEVTQPKEHFWDVFDHSMETVASVERLLMLENEIVVSDPWLGDLVESMESKKGDIKRSVLLKVAAILHDVAKPRTKNVEADGRVHFFGHTNEGAEIAGQALERLKFGKQHVKMVQEMVAHHLRLWQMGNDSLPTRRAIYRYFRSTGEVAFDIILLSLADFLATQGPRLDLGEWRQHTRMMQYIICEYERDERIAKPPKLISGHDLIKLFNMQPGPEIGRILEAVREAQGSNEISTREEALEFVSKHVKCL